MKKDDGSSATSADLLAEWTHDPSSSLKTSPASSLQTVGTLWPESFTDWPTSATTSAGGLYRRPQLEHPISVSDGGDLLPTPTAMDQNSSGGSTLSSVTLTDAMVRGHGHAPPCSEGTGGRLPAGFVIGWDVTGRRPIAAITDEPWERLTIHQESEVFKLLAELALDVAPFTLPDNVEEFLEE